MDLRLRGKRALVTGSTSGIGFAIARCLARERAEVIVNGRTEDKVVDAVQRINSDVGSHSYGIVADLSSATGVELLAQEAGRIDILVNNVGIFEPKPFLEISDEDWFRFFEINVMSGVRLSRALLPHMLERDWGRIIFISSESGVQIPEEMIHYGMTKTAQLAVSRGIAESVAGTGVTVNAVLPGPTKSEGVVDFLGKVAAEHGSDTAESRRSSCARCAPPPSSSGLRCRKRWRTSSPIFAVKARLPRRAQPSASTAAWCGASFSACGSTAVRRRPECHPPSSE